MGSAFRAQSRKIHPHILEETLYDRGTHDLPSTPASACLANSLENFDSQFSGP